jgi:serine/threonine protein kinase
MSHCLNPVCNHINPGNTKFCQRCGAQLMVNDRYRAQNVIGQGGFGKTFLAIDEGKPSRPKCVIKQFTYNDPNSLAEAMRLFDEEAKRLDDLGKHPQIPELLGYAKLQDRQYLVQEFIDGQNLEHEQANSGPFTEAKLKALLEDLLEVLHFVHGKNVIHRDIKPENIIRRQSDGKAVLVDFGAAKYATATVLAKTGTIIGSPLYVAPEQTRGKAIPASDLYSLGVTCLYLLTQLSPFDLKDLDDEWVWRDFLSKNTISDGFARFLDKLVAAKPSQRYPSAAEALRDLNPSHSVAPTSTTGSAIQSSAAQIVPTPLITTISHKSFVETLI